MGEGGLLTGFFELQLTALLLVLGAALVGLELLDFGEVGIPRPLKRQLMFMLLLKFLLLKQLIPAGVQNLTQKRIQYGFHLRIKAKQLGIAIHNLGAHIRAGLRGCEQPLHRPIKIEVGLAFLLVFDWLVPEGLDECLRLDAEVLAAVDGTRCGGLEPRLKIKFLR